VRAAVFIALLLALAPRPAASDPARPSPFDHLGENMLQSAFGWPLVLHVWAAGSTVALMEEGVDAAVLRAAAREDEGWSRAWATPALTLGALLPLALPGSLFFWGEGDTARAGAAGLQAALIAFAYNNLLKALTGRIEPEPDHPDIDGQSRGFQPGFLRNGVFNGWPSGHAMVNAALAASFAAYYREKPWMLPAAIGYALYVSAAVTFGVRGRVHWLSDAVAGTLMGAGIGWTVGSRFARDRAGSSPAAFQVLPVPIRAGGVLALCGAL
jgi:membrane-associated phospholipid phosphatase